MTRKGDDLIIHATYRLNIPNAMVMTGEVNVVVIPEGTNPRDYLNGMLVLAASMDLVLDIEARYQGKILNWSSSHECLDWARPKPADKTVTYRLG